MFYSEFLKLSEYLYMFICFRKKHDQTGDSEELKVILHSSGCPQSKMDLRTSVSNVKKVLFSTANWLNL